MEMQGNATEIDERNLLQLDALLSHGYGLSPQLVMNLDEMGDPGQRTAVFAIMSDTDKINFIMAKVAAGEIDAATATELIAAARKDYEM